MIILWAYCLIMAAMRMAHSTLQLCRDFWSPSIARTRHEMGTIVSWHKIGNSKLEEARRTTNGYNCVSWKQGSLLISGSDRALL
jgi:hypothetical protein